MARPRRLDRTPLHLAARAGSARRVCDLIAGGADVDARGYHGHDYGPHFKSLTPLMVAAGSPRGSADAVKALLEAGADPHARNQAGGTALFHAASTGDAARVRLLLDAGCDPNEAAGNGRSVLGEACRRGEPESVRLLLEAGATADHRGFEIDLGLDIPGLDEALLPLADEADPQAAIDPKGHSAFQMPIFGAAESGSAECVRLLLERGVPVNLRDESLRTVLMHAGSADVVDILVTAGASLAAKSVYGNSVLDELLADGRFAAAEAVVAHGAPLRRDDGYCPTALFRYVGTIDADPQGVSLLLRLGDDPRARNQAGMTPLHYGVQLLSGDREQFCGQVVHLLVDAGADINAVDAEGATPLHYAVGDEGGSIAAVNALLQRGAKVDAAGATGRTPLMTLCTWGFRAASIVPILLEHGADPSLRDQQGVTARDLALEQVATWEQIHLSPPVMPAGYGPPDDPDETRTRHEEALTEAKTVLALLQRDDTSEPCC